VQFFFCIAHENIFITWYAYFQNFLQYVRKRLWDNYKNEFSESVSLVSLLMTQFFQPIPLLFFRTGRRRSDNFLTLSSFLIGLTRNDKSNFTCCVFTEQTNGILLVSKFWVPYKLTVVYSPWSSSFLRNATTFSPVIQRRDLANDSWNVENNIFGLIWLGSFYIWTPPRIYLLHIILFLSYSNSNILPLRMRDTPGAFRSRWKCTAYRHGVYRSKDSWNTDRGIKRLLEAVAIASSEQK
jgi:hypothetical protein